MILTRRRYVWFTVFAIDTKYTNNEQKKSNTTDNNYEPMKYFKWKYTHYINKPTKQTNKTKKQSEIKLTYGIKCIQRWM